jgi:ribosomal protein S12 methylthiotransferase
MRRPASSAKTLDRIHAWREQVPDLTIRSTFIVGFPGETDEDFDTLLAWLDEAQLDRVGCFQYSPVEGAAANELDGHVPEDLKQERWERFMERASAISEAKLAAKVGLEMQVLVDGRDEHGFVVARGPGDAPEVDGIVRIETDEDLASGDFVDVEITGADTYDLDARLLG